MPVEIERKFLVLGDAWRREADAGVFIRQGYLTKDQQPSVRVRISGTDKGKLTLKHPRSGITRLEYEYPIPVDEAEEMLDLCHGAIVIKQRYNMSMGDLVWQIDVFEGENLGLVMAEIELSSEGQEFHRPDWVGEEVTQDRRYQNSQLARSPYGVWSQAQPEPELETL